MSLPAYAKGQPSIGQVEFMGEKIDVISPTIAEMLQIKDLFAGIVMPRHRVPLLKRLLALLRIRPITTDDLIVRSDFDIMSVMFPMLLDGWSKVRREDIDGLAHNEAVQLLPDLIGSIGLGSEKKPPTKI